MNGKQGRLLIVDDDRANRELLASHFRREGHTCQLAENGREALELLRRQAFDLVLLDIMMPEMDGYQTLERLKADPALYHIPVIMMSALGDINSVIRCIELGAADYVFKPFDFALLKARVKTYLGKKQPHAQEQDRREYLAHLTDAVLAVEKGTLDPDSLAPIAERSDDLGQLARAVQRMGQEVQAREQRLRRQVQHLRVELDQRQPGQPHVSLPAPLPGSDARPEAAPSSQVLIVDDNRIDRIVLSSNLAGKGYTTETAESGLQALGLLQAQPFDLVLLDAGLPDMDGYTLCQGLKADERTRHVPVIITSTSDKASDKAQAFAVGAAAYLGKPFQLDEVLACVETHLAVRSLRKRLELARRELARQTGELQACDDELEAFARTVANDLKNPLGFLRGYAEFLTRQGGSLSRDQLLQSTLSIAQSVYKMNDIVQNLLLLAGVRKASVELERLDMATIVAQARRRLASLVEQTQAELAQPSSWPTAVGHAAWIEEVWVNYIGNALKYGGLPPHVELGAIEEASGRVRFWVRDNGPGLSPEEHARLFVPFERFDQLRVEGHGLGLSIVRRIVEKLGGQVGSQSGTAGGSIFWFVLPAAPDE